MRRMLASVAVLAAALLAPSVASATTAPVLSGPATSNASAPATIHLTWTDVSPQPGVTHVTYDVLRSSLSGTTCPATPTGTSDLSGALVDTLAFDDVLAKSDQGTYCYYVEANDGTGPADSGPLQVLYDTTAPAIVVTSSGGSGCSPFSASATVTDASGITAFTADTGTGSAPYTAGTPVTPGGAEFSTATVTFNATDAAGNSASASASGRVLDATRPPAPVLEVDTDPMQQTATLSWQPVTSTGAHVLSYSIHTKGPQGSFDLTPVSSPSVVKLAQVDATYEYSLTASDACGPGAASVRLVRLNDTAPPSMPQVAQPAFDASTHAIQLNWIPSTDNIQVDHYEVLRNGVPLTATDASAAVDPAPPQHTLLSYLVRAVDTNGNETDSKPVTYMTPDWTPPTEPVLTLDRSDGASVTLRWSAARDNVGVVRYDILRNEKLVGSVTGSLRTYRDPNLKPALYTWRVLAVDDAGNATPSAPQSMRVVKPHASAKLVSLKRIGAERAIASRYSLKGPARLLLDLRVSGTIAHARLRIYVPFGRGRITVWRGVPGSSAPRQRLHSALVHHGWVTVRLRRAFHTGRIRLVLITSGRMVVIGTGRHKPSLRAG